MAHRARSPHEQSSSGLTRAVNSMYYSENVARSRGGSHTLYGLLPLPLNLHLRRRPAPRTKILDIGTVPTHARGALPYKLPALLIHLRALRIHLRAKLHDHLHLHVRFTLSFGKDLFGL